MENTPFVKTIAPGVRLCAVQTDRFKTGCISFSMALPMDGGIAEKAILPYILHRSCKKYPDFSFLNGRLAELYGAALSAGVSKLGEAQLLSINLTSIDDRFSLTGESIAQSCTELLLDLIFDPDLVEGCFGEEAVQREKRLLIEKMESEMNDKRAYALRRCEEIMCAGERFGLSKYGTKEEIEALTGESIYAAWQNMLKTAIIQIDMVGSGANDSVADALTEQFAKIERCPAEIQTLFVKMALETRREEETLPVKQGKLVLGFRSGMNDALDEVTAVKVMTDLFGGGTYSKLFKNVREKMSLCYYCSARLNHSKGVIFVQSGIESDKEQLATEAIMSQFEAVKAGEIEDDDLTASQMSICDHLRSIEDSPEDLATWYTSQLLKPEIKTPEQETEKIRQVTMEQVVAAANRVTLDTIFMLSGTGEAETDEN
ncbi:MAG: insulinase family protein [Eubacteriales bacterium]